MSSAAFGSFGAGSTPPGGSNVQAKFSGLVVQGEAGATVTYLSDGGIASASNQLDAIRYPVGAGTMSVLRVCAPLGNASGQTVNVTLYKNNVATAQTIAIPDGTVAGTKFVDSAHPIAFAAGDDFDLRCDVAAVMAASVAVSATLTG